MRSWICRKRAISLEKLLKVIVCVSVRDESLRYLYPKCAAAPVASFLRGDSIALHVVRCVSFADIGKQVWMAGLHPSPDVRSLTIEVS